MDILLVHRTSMVWGCTRPPSTGQLELLQKQISEAELPGEIRRDEFVYSGSPLETILSRDLNKRFMPVDEHIQRNHSNF